MTRSLVVFCASVDRVRAHYLSLFESSEGGEISLKIYFLGSPINYETLRNSSPYAHCVQYGLPDNFFAGLSASNGTLYLCDTPDCQTLLPHLPLEFRFLVTQDPDEIAYAQREQIRVITPSGLAALLSQE